MADLVNSTVQALGIGTAFRKRPVGMDFFLHGYNNIFSSLCNYKLTNPSSIDPPTETPQKKMDSKTFLFQTVELFQLARK